MRFITADDTGLLKSVKVGGLDGEGDGTQVWGTQHRDRTISRMCWCPGQSEFLAARANGLVEAVSAEDGSVTELFSFEHAGSAGKAGALPPAIRGLAALGPEAQARRVVCCTEDAIAQCWSRAAEEDAEWQCDKSWELTASGKKVGDAKVVDHMRLSSSQRLMAVGGREKDLQIWDVRSAFAAPNRCVCQCSLAYLSPSLNEASDACTARSRLSSRPGTCRTTC